MESRISAMETKLLSSVNVFAFLLFNFLLSDDDNQTMLKFYNLFKIFLPLANVCLSSV